MHDFPELRVSVAALNSCEKETHKPEDHIGVFSKEQARALMTHWSEESTDAWIKIAAIHHNPVAPTSAVVNEWRTFLAKSKNREHVSEDLAERFLTDLAGFNGCNFLRNVSNDREVQLILHGHQHADARVPWPWEGSGRSGQAHVFSTGSMGLLPDKLPEDQPNQVQLIVLDTESKQLCAYFLVYEKRKRAPESVEFGHFVPDPAMISGYTQNLYLPKCWNTAAEAPKRSAISPENTTPFLREYRKTLGGLYDRWDLRNVGTAQAGGAGRPADASLDKMYLPLRFAEGYDINKLDMGQVIDPGALLGRRKPLAIRGAAGSGKTTWMRWTFRQLLRDERALPIMIELRRLARDWVQPGSRGEMRCIETYAEDWAAEFLGKGFRGQLGEALRQETGPRPVLLVDGWDELGDLGEELRAKLVGFMETHPRVLVVVSSRPYGEGRPSHAEGFEVLDVQPLSNPEIELLAKNFFMRCYHAEEQPAEELLKAFMDALERSQDAAVLARTALLLTMMLLISRSSPLPDKRHQLYETCIKNLLTALPDRQEVEGVALGIQQWRPPNGEERFRAVAALAYAIQNEGYKKKSRGTIVLKGKELCDLLPEDLAWKETRSTGICGLAGGACRRAR